MTAPDIIKDLKARKFKPLYLLHGEEAYYIDLLADQIEASVLSEAERGFNQTILYGKDTDIISVINAAKRYPMMSEYQVIIVKEAQDLKWGKDGDDDKKSTDPALAYFEHPLNSTILVFAFKHNKFDKRKKNYKAIEKNGVIFESSPIYENKIPAWIEDYTKEQGYKISPKASALMSEYLGNDLSKVANELDKLMLNIQKGQEINTDHVQNNIGISKDYNVFELQGALSKRDVLKVNQIVNYFASNPKANPIQMVIANLNGYFTKVFKYHYITDKSNAAKELGVNPYFVKDYELAARNYNLSKMFQVVSILREYDLKSKGVDSTGNAEDGDLLKEMMFKIIH